MPYVPTIDEYFHALTTHSAAIQEDQSVASRSQSLCTTLRKNKATKAEAAAGGVKKKKVRIAPVRLGVRPGSAPIHALEQLERELDSSVSVSARGAHDRDVSRCAGRIDNAMQQRMALRRQLAALRVEAAAGAPRGVPPPRAMRGELPADVLVLPPPNLAIKTMTAHNTERDESSGSLLQSQNASPVGCADGQRRVLREE